MSDKKEEVKDAKDVKDVKVEKDAAVQPPPPPSAETKVPYRQQPPKEEVKEEPTSPTKEPQPWDVAIETSGHVFILLSDVRMIECDYWAVPGGGYLFSFLPMWLPSYVNGMDVLGTPAPDYLPNLPRIRKYTPWPHDRPQPFIVSVRGRITNEASPDLDAISEMHHQFFSAIEHEMRQELRQIEEAETKKEGKIPPPVSPEAKPHEAQAAEEERIWKKLRVMGGRNGRGRKLVCLPLLGTGAGGYRQFSGAVLKTVLPILYRYAKHLNVDIALVSNQQLYFNAMQEERKKMGASAFSSLTPSQLNLAKKLGRYGEKEKLVLFLGAGVSMGAGLPSWATLLKELAQVAQLNAEEISTLSTLSFLDQARIIEMRLGGSSELVKGIVKRLERSTYSIQHALLSQLPVKEVVTTNYDQLFEMASKATIAYHDIAVLPYHPSTEASRWILKMHGCVSHPQDIVITRENYIRYQEGKAALAGIVQSLLITKHMLFVGFSLNDDNFHRVVDAVRRALPTTHKGHFGTALFLINNDLMAELWSKDLDVISLLSNISKPTGADWARAARRLEIFLDHLGSVCCSSIPHLLDDKFAALLSPEELCFRNYLKEMFDKMPPQARGSMAYQKFKNLIQKHFAQESPLGFYDIPPKSEEPGHTASRIVSTISRNMPWLSGIRSHHLASDHPTIGLTSSSSASSATSKSSTSSATSTTASSIAGWVPFMVNLRKDSTDKSSSSSSSSPSSSLSSSPALPPAIPQALPELTLSPSSGPTPPPLSPLLKKKAISTDSLPTTSLTTPPQTNLLSASTSSAPLPHAASSPALPTQVVPSQAPLIASSTSAPEVIPPSSLPSALPPSTETSASNTETSSSPSPTQVTQASASNAPAPGSTSSTSTSSSSSSSSTSSTSTSSTSTSSSTTTTTTSSTSSLAVPSTPPSARKSPAEPASPQSSHIASPQSSTPMPTTSNSLFSFLSMFKPNA